MLTGISVNLQDVSDSGKTAVINNELMRLNVDIATLQDARLADSGVLKENDFWATSMLAWAQITTRGPPALDSSAWVK